MFLFLKILYFLIFFTWLRKMKIINTTPNAYAFKILFDYLEKKEY